MNLFITAIDTNVGKTIVSSLLVEQLGWNYWKPVQSGLEPPTDTQRVQELVSRKDVIYYPETYRLTQPLSPHASAKLDNVNIELSEFIVPQKDRLIIEGAGGLMVPLNDKGDCIIDLIERCHCEVIVVSRNYLGSINHTLLTLHALQSRSLKVKGIIVVGESNAESERIIQTKSKCPIIGRIPQLSEITKKTLRTSLPLIEL
jgi:dethiobiotin synthetase